MQASKVTSDPLVIFHSMNGVMHCDDGFASAYVVDKYYNADVELVPGIYGGLPPDVKGRNVIFVDFSYKADVMRELAEKASSILVLDHHKTAEEELKDFVKIDPKSSNPKEVWEEKVKDYFRRSKVPPIAVYFDMNRSGAGIAWDFYFPHEPRPALISYIEDGDLWRYNLPFSREVQASLRSYPQNLMQWEALMSRPIEEMAFEGKGIRRFIDTKVNEIVENARPITLAGHNTWAVACPKFLASDVAGMLTVIKNCEFAAAYADTKDFRSWSLRSKPDFDCSEIAKKFGGGGHKNSAGFETPLV